MSKYQPLTNHLRRSGSAAVRMTFEDIERVIGAALPPSAARRAWWSNNPTNNVMTRAWLAAEYRSTRVDLENRTVVFVRVQQPVAAKGRRGGGLQRDDDAPVALAARSGATRRHDPNAAAEGNAGDAAVSGGTVVQTGTAAPPAGNGGAPDDDSAHEVPARAGWFAGFYGGLRGTVTIPPGTDLTAPIDEEWKAGGYR